MDQIALSRNSRTYLLHIALFLATLLTTTLAGVQWINENPFELSNFAHGLPYSISLLAILTAHEFGHFFAARYYNVNTTLPFFIPIPPFLLNPFGTMGAVIRIRSQMYSKRALFDIGIAGPIAGLVVTLAVLVLGLATLPPKEYLYSIHPQYRGLPSIPAEGLTFGTSIFFWLVAKLGSGIGFFPPMNEVYHYPFLCVAWFGLFVTALNLIPVGQLDGGHILYALVDRKQGIVARIFWGILIAIGLASFLPFFGAHIQLGTVGWLLWAIILFFIIKLDHPEIPDVTPLDPNRRLLGWASLVIFVLTFPPIPFLEIGGS